MLHKYYHATQPANLSSILQNGIKKGFDGVVYLAETPEDAAKFLAIRLFKDILVFEVELDDKDVCESFDHSYSFFQCRAFTYNSSIDPLQITNCWGYTTRGGRQ